MAKTLARVVAIGLIAACWLVGIYGTWVNSFQNGYFDAMGAAALTPDPPDRYIPGAPAPLQSVYTGIDIVDRKMLLPLVAFFATILDGARTWDVSVSYWYLIITIIPAWLLLVLEGFRAGNRGRLVSWTGAIGFVFQNVTYAVTIPIYFVLHMFTSPTGSGPTAGDVIAPAAKTRWMALSCFLGFLVPAVVMDLPSPEVVWPSMHYNVTAFWQIFPVTQSILQFVFGFIFPNKTPKGKGVERGISKVSSSTYKLIIGVCVLAHCTTLAIALLPESVGPDFLKPVLAETTFSNVFVPASLFSPPTIDATVRPVPDELAPLGRHFLQWDIYSGNVAMVVWAAYLGVEAVPGFFSAMMLVKLLCIGIVGGPVAVAATILWERDVRLNIAAVAKGTKKRH